MALPRSVKYLVIGAGVHGLSTAWHLAKEQRARGEEPDVLILDKTGVGAGASGIACGVVRNNYFQPAMSELMAANVEVWEQDPQGFSYHPVGYCALGSGGQVSDLTEVHERQQRIGYPSRADRRRRRPCARTCARCSPTGGRRASRCACTRRRAATPTTWRRCRASPRRRARPARGASTACA